MSIIAEWCVISFQVKRNFIKLFSKSIDQISNGIFENIGLAWLPDYVVKIWYVYELVAWTSCNHKYEVKTPATPTPIPSSRPDFQVASLHEYATSPNTYHYHLASSSNRIAG